MLSRNHTFSTLFIALVLHRSIEYNESMTRILPDHIETPTSAWSIKYDVREIAHYIAPLTECKSMGAEAAFYMNGAEPNRDDSFAIKLFASLWDAVVAYVRQRAAAQHGYAPPVGRFVVWTCPATQHLGAYPQYGYETAVADVCHDPVGDYTYAQRRARVRQGFPSPIVEMQTVRILSRVWFKNSDEQKIESWDDLVEALAGDDPFGAHASEFADKLNACLPLVNALRDLPATNEEQTEGRKTDPANARTFRESRRRPYYADMHGGNVGIYCGRLVCIDFGDSSFRK